MEEGKIEKSEKTFKKGIEFESLSSIDTNKRIFNNIGLLYYSMRKVKLAKQYLSIAIKKYGSEIAKETLALTEQLEKTQNEALIKRKSTKGQRFIIFRKKNVEEVIPDLREGLEEDGFGVYVWKSPLGYNKPTNALFVGKTVPLPMIKSAISRLRDNDIPFRSIVYPWTFKTGRTNEIQLVHAPFVSKKYNNDKLLQEDVQNILNAVSIVEFEQLVQKYSKDFR